MARELIGTLRHASQHPGGFVVTHDRLDGIVPIGSAKGVMFITIEDETGIANPILWPSKFKQKRRIVTGARMLGLYAQVQREGEVVPVIVKKLVDRSVLLSTLSERSTPFPIRYARADGVTNGGCPDPRAMSQPRDILIPDLHKDTARDRPLVKSCNFKWSGHAVTTAKHWRHGALT